MIKIPKEILNLFPTWEYCCPVCGTYVQSGITFCPNCKTPFNELKWRVPPRFLKSHKAMSKYAHEVLAPRLTPNQRELLFRSFTQLFADGFETGNFNAWDGTVGSPTVQSTVKHHGTYAMQTPSAGGDNNAYKNYGAGYTTVFARIYWMFTSTPTATYQALSFLAFEKNGTRFARVSFRSGSPATNLYIRLSYYAGGTEYTADWQNNALTANTWYCIELKIVRAAAGEYRVWVDGTERIAVTNQDNTAQGVDIDQVRVGGIPYPNTDNFGNYRIDCVVVADTYIGPEVEVVPVGGTVQQAKLQDII